MLLTAWKHTERNRYRNRKYYYYYFMTPVQSLTVKAFFRAYLVTILKALGYGVESKSITTYTIDEGKCPA